MAPAAMIVVLLVIQMSTDVKGDSKSTAGGGYVPTRAELDAIRQVESGICSDPLNAVGDRGRSIGPYQIMKDYHADASKFDSKLPPYEKMKGPGSISNSERAMQAYSHKYTTKARLGHEPTFEDFVRNHNGGPNGYKKDSTIGYYEKVKKFLP